MTRASVSSQDRLRTPASIGRTSGASRLLTVFAAITFAAVGLLATFAVSADAYEYHTAPASSTQITYPSGLTATYSTSGPLTTQTNTHSASNAATSMFSPTNLPLGTTAVELLGDLSGCTTTQNTTAICNDRGTVTITFNRPVTNPVIHVSGLGGAYPNIDCGWFCTTTALYHLSGTLSSSSPAGATLGAVPAGAANFMIDGNTFRASNDRLNHLCDTVGAAPRQAVGGCGTVPVIGTVTSVTFSFVGRTWADRNATIPSGGADAIRISHSPGQDFSDAPTSYNPTQAPAHAVGNLKLGATIDQDQPNTLNPTTSTSSVAAGANANGANGDGADEDAISSWPLLTTANAGSNYSVTVPISGVTASGRVCGWIDFNRGGTFDNTNERACGDFISGATSVNLTWAVPASATTAGISYARLRASYNTTQAQSPTGLADSGEVEDYTVAVLPVVRVNKVLTSMYSDTFNLRLNGTTFATGVGNGGTTGNRTTFHTSAYGTPDFTVAQNVASAAIPVTFDEVASGGNQGTYGTNRSCVDATGASVGSGGGTSITVNVPQSNGTNARAQNITCTFTNVISMTDPVITAPSDGSVTNDNTPTISGTSQPNATVDVYEDLTLICTATANGAGAWSCTAGSAQSDGDHDYRALANYGGSYSNFSEIVTLTIDTAAPAAPTISSPTDSSVTSDTTPTVSGTAEANSTVTVYVDGSPVGSTTADGSGNWSFDIPSAQSEGSHTISATATDAATNTSAASLVTTVVIDTTSPIVSISDPANGSLTGDTTPTLNFSVTETNPGTTECRVDGGSWTACTSGNSLATLSDGPHTVDVRHTDGAGNVGSTSSTFTVDTTAPSAPVITSPTTGLVTSDNTPTISGTAEANSTVEVFADGNSVGTTTADGSGNWSLTPGTPLADDTYDFTANATDEAGNTSVDSNTVGVTIDTVAPSAPVITAPSDGSVTGDNTPTISGTAEANSTVEVFADGNSVGTTTADGSGNWSLTPATPLADDTYDFTANATDAASNTGVDSNSVSVTIDTTAPSAPVITAPSDGSVTGDNTPTISGTAEANSTVEVFADGNSVGTTTADGSGNWTLTPSTPLADDTYDFTANATDAAGNTSVDSNTVSVTIDTAAPSAPAITAPTNGSSTNDDTPAISGTAEANSTVTVFVDGSPIGTTTADGSGNWSLTPAAPITPGDHDLTATSTDAAGNESAPSTAVTITIDTTNPVVLISSPAAAAILGDNTPTISFSATDDGSLTIECSVDGGAFVACGPTDFTTGSLSDAEHTVVVRATDAGGNVGSAAVTFTVDTTAPGAPAITSPTTGLVTSDNTPTISGTAEANSTVEVFADGNSVGTTTADGSGNWSLTPGTPLADDTYDFTANATDEAGNTSVDSNTVGVTIDTVAPSAPVITAPSDGSVTGDNTPTISGTAEANSTVEVFADGNSVGTTTADGSGNWSLTPATPLADDTYDFTANATDAASNTGVDSNSVSVTIDTTAPSAPVITAPSDGSVTGDNTPTISGTAEANSTVEVFADGNSVGTTTADGSGNWTLTPSTPLADDTYDFTANATDAAGNTSVDSNTVSVTIDTAAPSAPAITAPTNGSSTNDDTPAISGTAEANSTVTVFVDGSPIGTTTADGSGNWSLTPAAPITPGDHDLTATSTDAAGNESAPSTAVTITIDTTNPVVLISSPAAAAILGDNTPTISFSATDDGSLTIECSVDGGAFVACGPTDFTTGSLSDAEHTVVVRATDAGGNVGSAAVTFTVDTTAPGAPAITSPTTGLVTSDNTPTISGTAEAGSTLEVFADGNSVGTTTADGSGNWSLTPATPLADDTYDFTANATDAAGNTGVDSNSVSATIDTAAPSAPVISSPSGDVTTSDTTPTIGGTAEPNSTVTVFDGVTEIGTTTADGSGDWTFTPSTPLAAGPHTITATATDAADNESASSNAVVITVDTSLPAVAISSPSNAATLTDDSPTIEFTATDDGPLTIECSLDAAPFVACGPTEFSVGPLADGAHSVTVRATDDANNVSTAIVNFTVDTTAPAVPAITGPSTGTTTSDDTPEITGTAEANTTVSIYDDGVLIGTTTSNGSGDWTFTPSTPLAEGANVITATASDEHGNESNESSPITINVDTVAPTAPVIDAPTDGSSTTNTLPTISGTAEPFSTVTVTVDGGEIGTTTADVDGNWSLTPSAPLSEGDRSIVATSTDAADNVSVPSNTVDLTVDTTPPSLTIDAPSPDAPLNTDTPSIEFTATDDGPITTECSIDGGAFAPCTSPFAAGPLADGEHTVTVRVTDEAGNVSQTGVSFTVDTVAPDTSLTAVPDALTSQTSATFEFTASQSGSTFECSVDGGSFADCSTPLDLTGLGEGAHAFEVRASDPAGNTDQTPATYNWTIDLTAPAAPVITGPSDGSTTSDSTPTITGTAEAGSTVTVYVDGSPIGTTTTDGSGDWTFTPSTSIGDGTYDLTAVAEDAAGNDSAASDSSELTIDSTAPNTSITDPPGTLTTSTSATFEFAADEPADRFECSLNGATFATCPSTMTLTSLTDGNYTMQVRAVDLSGNTDTTPASHSWTVDTTPPSGNVVQQVGSGGNGVPPTFSISSDDPGATQTCAISGGTPVSCGSPFTPTGLAPGSYSMVVTFTDEAGNSSTRSLNFVVTAPVVTPPPPAPTPAPAPPSVAPEESDPLPAACFPKGITIYNLKVVGRKLRIQGFARSQYIGQKVTINYRPTKNKVIGKATVKSDGSFIATVKAPSKKLRRSGATRYRANVGKENSLWFKLARRMGSSEATWKNGKLRVSGFLTKPLAPKATLTVNVRTGCNDPWKKVAVIKTSKRSGKFKANIPYEMTGNVVFVRMYAKVRRKAKSKKTLTTYSFSIPVVAQR